MYSRSAVPRSAATRSRMASSSRPSSSTCDSVRVTVMGVLSEVQFDVADGNVDAQLDLSVGIAVRLAGADVSGAAARLQPGAGEADAHPAAVLGIKTRGLGLLEQGGAGVLGTSTGRTEADGARG